MQKSLISFDGTKIVYDIARHGNKFLILLHGAGGNLSAWNAERAYLSKFNISSLAIDLRGHGMSGNPTDVKNYSLSCFAKDVEAILKKERIKKFILVGHCCGGMVAVMFHKLFPKKAMAYLLIDTSAKGPRYLKKFFKMAEPLIPYINKAISNKSARIAYNYPSYSRFKGTSDLNWKRIKFDIQTTGLKEWLFTYENLAKYDGTKILSTIKQPVKIIHGEKDTIFTVDDARKIASLAKKTKLELIKSANHILIINNPRKLGHEIKTFYDEIF